MSSVGVVGRIASIPLLLWAIVWVIECWLNPSPENLDRGGELIARAATPWWVPFVEHLPEIALALLAVMAVGFLYMLLRDDA